MTRRVEGTFILDGLVEGPLPDQPDAEERLRGWVALAGSRGLRFSLEVEGARFSILADNRPREAARWPDGVGDPMAEALRDLLVIFPREQRAGLVSTVRSVEYRPGQEVQTLYAVRPDGQIRVQERRIDAETVAPPEPVSSRAKLKLAGLGVAVALAAFGISALFVDYGKLFDSVVESLTPFDADKLQVEAGRFGDYFTIEKKAGGRGNRSVVLTLKRTRRYPTDAAATEKLAAEAGKGLAGRLALEAVVKGYVRCEYFDAKGLLLGFSIERIADLRDKETIDLALPMPRNGRLVRVVLTY